MRRLAVLVLLTVPLAARADGVIRSDDVHKAVKELAAAAGSQFLCDSVVAEDCFRLLADRLEIRRILNERCEASIPERERSPECKQPRR